jgi:hypothetical protein
VLARFLALFGFDLHRQIQLVKDRAEEFARETSSEITSRLKDLGVTVALAAAGMVFAVVTLIVGLMALYTWMTAIYGPLVGYAVVGGTTAMLAAVMLIVASGRNGAPSAPHAAAPVEPVEVAGAPASLADPPRPAMSEPRPLWPAGRSGIPLALDLRRPLSGALQDFLARPLTTGTPVDAVIRRAMSEAHAASPQAVDMAADLLRTGPRSALIGVLGGAALLGWFLGRNGGSFVYLLEGWPRPR